MVWTKMWTKRYSIYICFQIKNSFSYRCNNKLKYIWPKNSSYAVSSLNRQIYTLLYAPINRPAFCHFSGQISSQQFITGGVMLLL